MLVSAVGALPVLLWRLDLHNYLTAFFILLCVQSFVGMLWNYIVDKLTQLRFEEALASQKLADSIQHIEINCSYCGANNLVRILLGKQNTFLCSTCKENNSVHIDITCARITKPIMPKAELSEIFKNLDTK